jgi:hypothetical protein
MDKLFSLENSRPKMSKIIRLIFILSNQQKQQSYFKMKPRIVNLRESQAITLVKRMNKSNSIMMRVEST